MIFLEFGRGVSRPSLDGEERVEEEEEEAGRRGGSGNNRAQRETARELWGGGGGGRLRGREGERRGRERRNIDRISVATDSIYPLLTGLLLGGFNFDSSRR